MTDEQKQALIEEHRREGIDAYDAGQPRSSNPYSYEASRAWDSGWLQGQQAAEETSYD
jgi:hypothetical protein